MRFLIELLVLSVPLLGQTTCSKANFEPPAASEGALTNEFKGSVLRLQVSGSQDSGTGYLIDSANGYLITAFHVIANAPPKASIDVSSPDSRFAGVKLTATVVKSLGALQPDGTVSAPDLALLKLDNPSLIKPLRPVDVSLRYPSIDQALYAMGYPQLGSLPNTTFSEQLVRFMAAPDDGSIEVTQAIFGGNSGGPLMDPSGSVVGTCRESVGIGAAVARYTPMIDGEALLDLIPLSDRMKTLDGEVRSSSISESALEGLLTKNSSNPTNVELYTWARYISANRAQYTSVSTRKLLQCPIRALMQRGMDDVVIELSPFGDLDTVGDANVAVAQREITRGRPLAAAHHVQAATAAYASANDTLGTYKATMLSASINLKIGSLDAAASDSGKVLAHINSLPQSDKATALSIAASIDLARGNAASAITKLNTAAQYSIAAGDRTKAANLLTQSADASLKVSKPLDAKGSLTKAMDIYKGENNTTREAESVYELGAVDSSLGDDGASREQLEQYLVLQPQGTHAAEAKKVLTTPPDESRVATK